MAETKAPKKGKKKDSSKMLLLVLGGVGLVVAIMWSQNSKKKSATSSSGTSTLPVQESAGGLPASILQNYDTATATSPTSSFVTPSDYTPKPPKRPVSPPPTSSGGTTTVTPPPTSSGGTTTLPPPVSSGGTTTVTTTPVPAAKKDKEITLQKNRTISSIAAEYGVSVASITSQNKGTTGSTRLTAGSKLRVPATPIPPARRGGASGTTSSTSSNRASTVKTASGVVVTGAGNQPGTTKAERVAARVAARKS
jgi:hypothetical protein